MKNLTQEQIDLQAYIESSNEAIRERFKENPKAMFTTTVSDPLFWEKMGVTNIKTYEHSCAQSFHYDLYKEINGIRPRWMNYDAMTTEEINEDIDRLLKQQEYEEQYELECKALEIQRAKDLALANAYKPNNVFADLKSLISNNV